jgi:hypothetical protein
VTDFLKGGGMLIRNVLSCLGYTIRKMAGRILDIYLTFARDYFNYKYPQFKDEKGEDERINIPANFR